MFFFLDKYEYNGKTGVFTLRSCDTGCDALCAFKVYRLRSAVQYEPFWVNMSVLLGITLHYSSCCYMCLRISVRERAGKARAPFSHMLHCSLYESPHYALCRREPSNWKPWNVCLLTTSPTRLRGSQTRADRSRYHGCCRTNGAQTADSTLTESSLGTVSLLASLQAPLNVCLSQPLVRMHCASEFLIAL